MTDPQTVTFAGLARILGVKPQAVTALRHAGRLVLTDDGQRVLVEASQQRLAATADPSKAGVVARHAAARQSKVGEGAAQPPVAPPAPTHAASEPGDRIGNTYQASRAVRERYLAMEAKRAFEVAIGKLMDADEVASVVAAATTTLRTRLESLPDVLGPQLAAIHDEGQVRAIIAEAIEHALEEAARHFATTAKQAAA